MAIQLTNAVEEPRFEFSVQGVINGFREGVSKLAIGVPLLGKPDIRFVNAEGAHVIFDWKVNGYCGKGNTSPVKGYCELYQCDSAGHWSMQGSHKSHFPKSVKGIIVNGAMPLEQASEDWAAQLATYGWLLGEQVGTEIINGVDQVVGNGTKTHVSGGTMLRFAQHRSIISEDFQFKLFMDYQHIWNLLTEEPFHFFRDLSLAESQAKCGGLDSASKALAAQAEGKPISDAEWVLSIITNRRTYA